MTAGDEGNRRHRASVVRVWMGSSGRLTGDKSRRLPASWKGPNSRAPTNAPNGAIGAVWENERASYHIVPTVIMAVGPLAPAGTSGLHELLRNGDNRLLRSAAGAVAARRQQCGHGHAVIRLDDKLGPGLLCVAADDSVREG